MVNFKMLYSENSAVSCNDGIAMETYGVTLKKILNDGSEEKVEIFNISNSKSKVAGLLKSLERGFVTPMTVYEIIEDFLEM